MTLHTAGVTMDCADPRALAPFWTKNRLHLDFHCDDRAAEVARLVGLGAIEVGEHAMSGFAWTVLADPDGNEFCVAATTGQG